MSFMWFLKLCSHMTDLHHCWFSWQHHPGTRLMHYPVQWHCATAAFTRLFSQHSTFIDMNNSDLKLNPRLRGLILWCLCNRKKKKEAGCSPAISFMGTMTARGVIQVQDFKWKKLEKKNVWVGALPGLKLNLFWGALWMGYVKTQKSQKIPRHSLLFKSSWHERIKPLRNL